MAFSILPLLGFCVTAVDVHLPLKGEKLFKVYYLRTALAEVNMEWQSSRSLGQQGEYTASLLS